MSDHFTESVEFGWFMFGAAIGVGAYLARCGHWAAALVVLAPAMWLLLRRLIPAWKRDQARRGTP